MRELNFFEKIVTWFKSLFINKQKMKENSDKNKREICERAVQGGICPHACDECAWNTLYDVLDKYSKQYMREYKRQKGTKE